MSDALLLNADALHIPLADGSVHCCVTSPPYWGLRDYGIGGQLGLEPTPEEYVISMVAVFREVWRVLRNDGTLWLNIGDSYAGSGGPGSQYDNKAAGKYKDGFLKYDNPNRSVGNLKPKDLVGIPWMLAFALRADGWYLRSDIIWSKPNPMPESVTDRPTKSHEYLFLLTKRARYYYDQDAVRESHSREWWTETVNDTGRIVADRNDGGNRQGSGTPAGRNRRTVWTIATAPYSGAHFATFPPALVEPCIKAGSSEYGVCPKCGAPWERTVERNLVPDGSWGPNAGKKRAEVPGAEVSPSSIFRTRMVNQPITTGWQPTCAHDLEPVPAVVFDPFAGSGTTLLVARQLGRHGVGTDLSLEYLKLAKDRTGLTAWDEWQTGKKDGASVDDLPLFSGASHD